MLTNSYLAAGLFDSPWAIAVIVIVGAAINWLSQRRAAKSEDQHPAGKPSQPAEEPLDWETRLRRMLGEETPVPPIIVPMPGQAKPPLIRPALRPSAPSLRPPPVEVAPVIAAETSRGVERAIRRYEQLGETRAVPARAKGQTRSGRGSVLGTALHHPQSARQAFAASLVFGPPKALEVER